MTKKKAKEIMDTLYQTYPEAKCELDHMNEFQLLVATVLSAQTTDKSVNKATPELFQRYGTPEALAAADIGEVEKLIKSIGLYKAKAKNIIELAKGLLIDFNGEVPKTIEELVTLKGVGRKTANVVVSNAFGVPAIAVDTHVFRVTNRIGLIKASTVEATEQLLMKLIPKDQWIQAHHTFIFHGRYCCDAKRPQCQQCPIAFDCRFNLTKKA